MGKTPETSEELRLMAPLNREPPEVLLTGKAEVRLAMVVEPLALIVNMATPVEEATTKGLMLPGFPWRLKVIVLDVALMPVTAPLSMNLPVVKEVAPFQMALKPVAPEPERPLPAEAMVIWPGVVVVMVTLEPAMRLVTPQEPLPWAESSWPVTVGEEVVAVPPLAIGITPVKPIVEVPEMAMLEPAVKREAMSE